MDNKKDFSKMTAGEIMARNVVTVPVDMGLDGLALLFSENRITGAPVVDFDLNVVGVVSETDLVRHQASAGLEVKDDWSFFRSMDADDVEAVTEGYQIQQIPDAVVGDIMTTSLVTADEATPIPELAKQMVDRKVHRLLIVKGRRLRGIVSTMDILRAVSEHVAK